MQTLPKKFRKDGFDFTLVKRTGYVAVFEKKKPGWIEPSWEVVLIQTHPAKTWPDGRITPERESLPPSESWGTKGWSFSAASHHNPLSDALDKFEKLVKG